MGAADRVKIDYACVGCGAQAVSVPDPEVRWSTTVVVPHSPGCPVAIRVALMRARALAGRRA